MILHWKKWENSIQEVWKRLFNACGTARHRSEGGTHLQCTSQGPISTSLSASAKEDGRDWEWAKVWGRNTWTGKKICEFSGAQRPRSAQATWWPSTKSRFYLSVSAERNRVRGGRKVDLIQYSSILSLRGQQGGQQPDACGIGVSRASVSLNKKLKQCFQALGARPGRRLMPPPQRCWCPVTPWAPRAEVSPVVSGTSLCHELRLKPTPMTAGKVLSSSFPLRD